MYEPNTDVIQGTLGMLISDPVVAKDLQETMANLKITSRSLDFWDMLIDVYVTDTKHLNNIIAALRATPQIATVDRARGR